MSTVITIATIVIAVALIAWFFLSRNPAKSEKQGLPEHDDTRSDRYYSGVDRPAGPDAEPMDAETMLGQRDEWEDLRPKS